MNFAVFVSGHGSNLQAIIDAVRKRRIKGKIGVVISDNPQAYALERSQKAGIKSVIINPKDFLDKRHFEEAVYNCLTKEKIDFIVLAGFMRILSPYLIRKYRHKILNIHPSLLPAFPGAHAIKDAMKSRVKRTGVTIHFVEAKVDSGPIILQESLAINPKDTLATLEAKIHKIEHALYPKAIDAFIRGRIKLSGNRKRGQAVVTACPL